MALISQPIAHHVDAYAEVNNAASFESENHFSDLPREINALIFEYFADSPTDEDEIEELRKNMDIFIPSENAKLDLWKTIALSILDLDEGQKLIHASTTINNVLQKLHACFKEWEEEALLAFLPRITAGPILQERCKDLPREKLLQRISMFIRTDRSPQNQTYLSIYDTPIKCIPRVLFTMQKLELVVINNTSIKIISSKIRQWKNVRALEIDRGKITNLPQGMADMSSLESINIDQNLLRHIPDVLAQIPSLKTVIANDNHISTFPDSLISGNIDALCLRGNQIADFPLRFVDWCLQRDIRDYFLYRGPHSVLQNNPCYHDDKVLTIQENGRAIYQANLS